MSKVTPLIIGTFAGGRLLGWPGAVLGAAIGYGVGWLLTPVARTAAAREGEEEAAGTRYPEEEMVEALREAGSDPEAAGEELVSLYRGVYEPPATGAEGGRPARQPPPKGEER